MAEWRGAGNTDLSARNTVQSFKVCRGSLPAPELRAADHRHTRGWKGTINIIWIEATGLKAHCSSAALLLGIHIDRAWTAPRSAAQQETSIR